MVGGKQAVLLQWRLLLLICYAVITFGLFSGKLLFRTQARVFVRVPCVLNVYVFGIHVKYDIIILYKRLSARGCVRMWVCANVCELTKPINLFFQLFI